MLLYLRHCKQSSDDSYGPSPYDSLSGGGGISGRRNSGIDRAVVESLPVFRFGSLRGQKEGLECAVCLGRFEPNEVLRLLPKCKHAFHVECVDIWLDGHSTCPLCRYRVDPEDVLLVEDSTFLRNNTEDDPGSETSENRRSGAGSSTITRAESWLRRVSGRHSSAGERTSNSLLQIKLHRHNDSGSGPGSASCRDPTSFRMSLDSSSSAARKKTESVAVGCFDRSIRKDGLLLTDGLMADRKSFERRFEHRIIVSVGNNNGSGGPHFHHQYQRWSDVQPSDLLYLRSEMIISESRRFSLESSSRPSAKKQQLLQQQKMLLPLYVINREGQQSQRSDDGNGRKVINSRSVSEITGLSRFSSRGSNNSHHHHRQRQAGVVSRWLAWISSQSHPGVLSQRTTTTPSILV